MQTGPRVARQTEEARTSALNYHSAFNLYLRISKKVGNHPFNQAYSPFKRYRTLSRQNNKQVLRYQMHNLSEISSHKPHLWMRRPFCTEPGGLTVI